MSGHSKWSKIKRQKAVEDSKRSKVFSNLARLITMESKKANGDVTSPGLRTVIEKARAANLPKENIERAITKGNEKGTSALDAVLYETYGPGGVAILIEAVTDNNNRTSAEIKHILSKHGSSLASPGSAAWAFDKTADGYEPKNTIDISEEDGEKLEELVDALEEHDDVQDVFSNAA